LGLSCHTAIPVFASFAKLAELAMASGKGSNPEWNSKGIITRILLDKEEEIQENLPLEVCVTNSTKEVQCGAPKIAKLVYNSNNYGLWYL